jgi:hypothetical protein
MTRPPYSSGRGLTIARFELRVKPPQWQYYSTIAVSQMMIKHLRIVVEEEYSEYEIIEGGSRID